MQQAPSPATPAPSLKQPQVFDYFLCLDFECTCKENDQTFQNEIIEFPIVLLNAHTLQIEDTFHSYVKPKLNPTLTPFCTKLTGITQAQVDAAPYLPQVLQQVHKWLISKSLLPSEQDHPSQLAFEHYCTAFNTYKQFTDTVLVADNDSNSQVKKFVFCCDGPWDLHGFLQKECTFKGIQVPCYYKTFCNARFLFAEYFKCSRGGIRKMLEKCDKMQFEGNEHSGIDDAKNLARIVKYMCEKGCVMLVNDGFCEKDYTVPAKQTMNELIKRLSANSSGPLSQKQQQKQNNKKKWCSWLHSRLFLMNK